MAKVGPALSYSQCGALSNKDVENNMYVSACQEDIVFLIWKAALRDRSKRKQIAMAVKSRM